MDTTPAPRARRRVRALAGLALAITTTAALVACSGGIGGDAASDSSGGASTASSESAPPETGLDAGVTSARSSRSGVVADQEAATAGDGTAERKVARGTVAVEADDVADARAEVQRITDSYGGQVAESDTETGTDGEVERTRVVLRIPVDDFDEAMDELEKVAHLSSSDQDADVVTAEYADLQARVRAQEASLRRVELLFSRAESIRDIVAIESQLTARQADLDSLKGQLRVLDDRTALSTITVHVTRTHGAAPVEEDEAGFLAGLGAGWDAMVGLGTGVATVSGALLPFAVLVALLGLPLAAVVRRLRRRPAPPTAAAAGGDAG